MSGVAARIWKYGRDFKIWALKGDLGAGKTALVQELTRLMGTEDHSSSPSYALVNEYLTRSGDRIYHLDLFRINTVSEALDIGFDEYLESGAYCFIEWPELVESLLPNRYLEVKIDNPEKEKREFKIIAHE